ncbi:MAG: Fic family protein, partial [bacterium]
NNSIDSIDPLLLIPIFIHDFLCIHPFSDGNGRMSRLLTTLFLYKSGYLIGKYISLESNIEQTKESYYNTLHISGINWHENNNDPLSFIKYILRIILCSYKEFEDKVNYNKPNSNTYEQVEKVVNNIIGKFTKNDILENVANAKKASVENAIKKMVDNDLVIKHGSGKNTFYSRKNINKLCIFFILMILYKYNIFFC